MATKNKKVSKERTNREVLGFILEQGSKLCMSQRTISKFTGYSTSTIARALASLEESNLIRIDKPTSHATPDTIVYIGPKQIKRSVTEVLNGVHMIIKSLLMTVATRTTKIKYHDDEIPTTIDPSKVLLYKKLPSGDAELIVLKR